MKVPIVHVRAAAVFAPSKPDDASPSKQVIFRDAQEQSRRGLGSLAAPARSLSLKKDRRPWMKKTSIVFGLRTQRVMDDLQVRLMVRAHMMTDVGHRGAVATLQRLSEYCCWSDMERHVTEFVRQCLHCMDSKAGERTGPWRVVSAEQQHVYGLQNIVSGEVRDVHVARLRFYADAALAITALWPLRRS